MTLLVTTTPDINMKALGAVKIERQTGIVGTSLKLANPPVSGAVLAFKNGALMDPVSAYSIAALVVTLGSAAISSDVFVFFYWYRTQA